MRTWIAAGHWAASATLVLAVGCGSDGAGSEGSTGDGGSLNGLPPTNGAPQDSGADPDSGGADAAVNGADASLTGLDASLTGVEIPTPLDGGQPDASDGGGESDAGDAGDADLPETPPTLLDLPFDGELISICYQESECNGDDLVCVARLGDAPGLCTEDCEQDSDCSAVDGLEPTCVVGRCLVNCVGSGNGDGECPEDMECRDLPTGVPPTPLGLVVDLLYPNYWCVYPEGAGTNDVPELGKCVEAHGDGDCEGTRVCHLPGVGGFGAHGYCADTCEKPADCEVPAGVTSTALCAAGACEFDCGGEGTTCPNGTSCRPYAGGFRCVYTQ